MNKKAKNIDNLDIRIGLHQGDVIISENDVLGDDVNVASRIEAFAAEGGVAISGKVQQNILSLKEFQTFGRLRPEDLAGPGQKLTRILTVYNRGKNPKYFLYICSNLGLGHCGLVFLICEVRPDYIRICAYVRCVSTCS